jgi:hypothetical protein
MRNDFVGKTVALTGCLAEAYNESANGYFPCSIRGGLFVVTEFHPFEPSAYVWSPGYSVSPADDSDADAYLFWVAAQDLEEQVNPHGHAIMLVQERDMAFAEENDFV